MGKPGILTPFLLLTPPPEIPIPVPSMKRLTLTFCALVALASFCYAGPEPMSGKDKEIQLAPPPCDWYHAHEWNLTLWAGWAFSGQDGKRDIDFDYEEVDEQFDEHLNPVFLGEPHDDEFLNKDNSWGGGMDLKYFWSKYMGAGLEGFVVDVNDGVGGAGLATFTFRYPIGCSRFAPYAWGGFGVVGGGVRTERFFLEHHEGPVEEENEREFVEDTSFENKHARVIGQLGAGLEARLLRPSSESKLSIGVKGDFCWNFIGGDHSNDQDFGMVRFGLNFGY